MAKTAAVPGSFNADEKAKKRAERSIIIGDRTFHPRKKTMAMMQQWNEVAPTAEQAQNPDRDTMENFRDIYKQLVVFLVDDEGNTPDQAFLEEQLDMEDAVDLLMDLQPQMGGERARDLPPVDDTTAT